MLLQLDQKSLFLGRKPNGFTETYYTEWDDGLGKTKISLFLVLSIGSSQVPGEEIGKEAFQLLQDHYLDDLAGDPYDRFENALREINLMVNEREKQLDMRFVPNVNVVCGVIEKDMLFLSQRGDAQGYLVRKRHVSSITEGLFDEKNTEDMFQNIASGVLEVNDSVILVTGKLIHYATPSELSKIFSEQSLSEAVKELEDMLAGDVEEQMAILTFDVLEKSEAKEVFVEKEIKKESQKSRMKDKLMEIKWVKPLHILRDWTKRQERFKTWGRDKILIAIVAGAIILTGGVAYLSLSLSTQKVKDAMQAKLDTAQEDINQAGTKGGFDKETASKLLDDAEALVVEVLNSEYLRDKASQMVDKIAEQRDFLDNVIHVDDELIKVADLSAIAGGNKVLGIVAYKDRQVAFTGKNIFQILIDQVSGDTAVSEGEIFVAGAYFGDGEKVLLLTESGKLIEYQDGNLQFADTADVEWKKGNGITTYSTKTYILDAANNQIWKYTHGRTAYSGAQAYFASGGDVSLANTVSLAIDGNVWTLDKDGTIKQYLSGEAVDFEINSAPLTPIKEASKIYTELDLKNIYVLDSGDKKVLVYAKESSTRDIDYVSQYQLDGIEGSPNSIYYDRIKGVLYIVTDSALYKLKI
ncbi:hypothetical protein HY463_01605 [Candidatus Peregrinibacteria bacterium]|nr:hypothetical protein [Candidatus Peregrinibacteria bacterium]